MNAEALEIIFELDGLSAQTAWEVILGLGILAPSSAVKLYDQSMYASEILGVLQESGKAHFDVQAEGCRFHFCPVTDFDHCLLEFHKSLGVSIDEQKRWIDKFASHSLISGRCYDTEYEHWQNAEDPIEYTTENRSYSHLRTYREPIFGDERIDISDLPGRRIVRKGYVEAIGSTMWVTERLSAKTGADLNKLRTYPWCKCETVFADVIRVHVMAKCFSAADGPQGRTQNMLREALFPRTALASVTGTTDVAGRDGG
jgi:hypothetical protein